MLRIDGLSSCVLLAGRTDSVGRGGGNPLLFAAVALLATGLILFATTAAYDSDGENVADDSYQITESTTSITQPGFYYLDSDIALTNVMAVNVDGTVTIDLRGHTLRIDPTNTGTDYATVIKVSEVNNGKSNTVLVIQDSSEDGTGTILAGNNDVWARGMTRGAVDFNGISMELKSGTITGGLAYYGGGVCVRSGTFTMSGGTITGNEANDGSGVYISTGAEFIMCGDSVISGNEDGTAVYSNGGTVSISGNAEISGNNRGIYAVNGTLTVSGSAVITNNTSGNGGGIWIAGTCVAVLSGNAKVTGNTSTNFGGGIHVDNLATLTISDNAEVTNNTANGRGGGIFSQGTVYITGGSVSNNTATGNGGGIWAGKNGGVSEVKMLIEISGGTISGNKAVDGGGLFIGHYSTRGHNNTSNIVYLVMSGGEISGNTATGYGGGVCAHFGSNVELTGGSISDNSATYGGGVMMGDYGVLDISELASVSDNSATFGGGLYVSASSFTMSGGEVFGNSATTDGGGVVVTDGQTYSDYNTGSMGVSGGTISGNTAGVDGGGVYADNSSEVSVSDNALISGNSSAAGGGMYILASSLEMSGGEVSGNTTTYEAAGICLEESDTEGSTFTMTGGTVTGNSAGTSGGGIVGSGSSTVDLTGGTVTGNEAAVHGADDYYYDGSFDVELDLVNISGQGTVTSFDTRQISLRLVPNTGYSLPATIDVTGSYLSYSYSNTTGSVTISGITGTVAVSASATISPVLLPDTPRGSQAGTGDVSSDTGSNESAKVLACAAAAVAAALMAAFILIDIRRK